MSRMQRVDIDKPAVERWYAEKFLEYYNLWHSTTTRFVRNWEQGKKNEPDAICSDGLEIEVTLSAYWEDVLHAERSAMKSNAPLDRGSIEAGLRVQTLSQDRMSVFLRSPDERAFLSFRRSIEKKLSKTYDLPPDHRNLLLLFVVYTPITTNTDFKEELLREPIVLPGNAQFSEVWYMQIRHISSKTPDPLVIEKFTDIWDERYSVFLACKK